MRHLPLNTFNNEDIQPLCNTEDNEPEFVLNINDATCTDCVEAEWNHILYNVFDAHTTEEYKQTVDTGLVYTDPDDYGLPHTE